MFGIAFRVIGPTKKGSKYQLVEKYVYQTRIDTPATLSIPGVMLHNDGRLLIFPGYVWDGASGPTIDDHRNTRAALVHDALYDMLKTTFLGKPDSKEWKTNRKIADEHWREIMLEDGSSKLRAWYYYQGVRLFGRRYGRVRKGRKNGNR